MKNIILLLLSLLLLGFGSSHATEISDKELLAKFLIYTGTVYSPEETERLSRPDAIWDSEHLLAVADRIYSARRLGYSLGNLLQYARDVGGENHKTWVRLDDLVQNMIADAVEYQGGQARFPPQEVETRKRRLLAQYAAALQGWTEPLLLRETGVSPKEAPDFFADLHRSRTALVPPTAPPAPEAQEGPAAGGGGRGFTRWLSPVTDPEYAARLSRGMGARDRPSEGNETRVDDISGRYELVWDPVFLLGNAPPRSEIRIDGRMHDVETEFRRWDHDERLTLHYKGRAKWDGGGVDADTRQLTGAARNQNGHDSVSVTITIQRQSDGIWRATHYNLASLWPIRRIEGDAPKERVRVLVIRNRSGVPANIELRSDPRVPGNWLGSVQAGASELFEKLPERGRWYILVEPVAPNTELRSKTFTLYIKEGVFDYVMNVLHQDFF